jgi:hypothetical protein
MPAWVLAKYWTSSPKVDGVNGILDKVLGMPMMG